MWTCRICRFDTELDDVVAVLADGTCVCLHCFDRETGGARRMPKDLRRELRTTLAAFEPA